MYDIACILICWIIPILAIGSGIIMAKKINKKNKHTIHGVLSEDEWSKLQKECGKVWIRIGILMLGISTVLILIAIYSGITSVEVLGYTLCLMQCIILVILISYSEDEIKNRIDKINKSIKDNEDTSG